METKSEKKGLLARLTVNKKPKKNSCCCNIELEEIPEEENDLKSPKIKDIKDDCEW